MGMATDRECHIRQGIFWVRAHINRNTRKDITGMRLFFLMHNKGPVSIAFSLFILSEGPASA